MLSRHNERSHSPLRRLRALGLLGVLAPIVCAEEGFDPLRGMDASGRIPKTEVPADVVHPERWRYVPAGRIPPGNLFRRFFVTSFIVPAIAFEEATGTEFGIGIADTDFRAQRRRELLGIFTSYSSEGQQRYNVVWERLLAHHRLPDDGVMFEERSQVRAQFAYERMLTRRFFGFGDSRDGDETSFTNERTLARFDVTHGLPDPGSPLIASLGLRYEHTNLSGGEVDDVPSTEQVYPQLVAAGDSHDSLWLGASLRYDVRDSDHQPYRGWDAGLAVAVAPVQSHGDVGALVALDASISFPIPSPFHDGGQGEEENPPTDSIAIGGLVATTMGDLPFYHLPSLGGPDTLRGYIRNRFTDESAWHLSAEWRTWPVPRGFAITDAIRLERIGVALFVDVGGVAEDLDDIGSADVQSSYGVGLRWAFERTALFRTDFAISDEDEQFVAEFGLSF